MEYHLPAQSKNLQKDVFNGYIVGNRNWNPEGEVFKVTSANYGTPSTLKRNDRFEIAAASVNRETLPQAIAMSFGSNRDSTKVRFQINCNAPLYVGDQLGPIKIVGYANTKGDSCTLPESLGSSDQESSPSHTGDSSGNVGVVGVVVGAMVIIGMTLFVVKLSKTKSSLPTLSRQEVSGVTSIDVSQPPLVWDSKYSGHITTLSSDDPNKLSGRKYARTTSGTSIFASESGTELTDGRRLTTETDISTT